MNEDELVEAVRERANETPTGAWTTGPVSSPLRRKTWAFGALDWGIRIQDGVPGIVGPDVLPARLAPDRGNDEYELNRAVLDRIMASLQFTD